MNYCNYKLSRTAAGFVFRWVCARRFNHVDCSYVLSDSLIDALLKIETGLYCYCSIDAVVVRFDCRLCHYQSNATVWYGLLWFVLIVRAMLYRLQPRGVISLLPLLFCYCLLLRFVAVLSRVSLVFNWERCSIVRSFLLFILLIDQVACAGAFCFPCCDHFRFVCSAYCAVVWIMAAIY